MKTILLADDEANLRMLVRTTLDDPQRRILEVADGVAALEAARRERPDLVILDWMMPGMSGIDVARALRIDPDTAQIPIIMLTAKGQEADREQGFAIGVHAYLVKPFSPLELLERVEQVTSASEVDIPEPTAEVRRELDAPHSQLALYARDLRRIASAERRRARDLAEANERLQILDRLKMDFLVFVSHELRTPLQHLGAVQMLDPKDDPAELAETYEMLRHGYERLETFVRKGLEYFEWLATQRVDVTQSADLAEAVHAVAASMPVLQEPGVDFRITTPGVPCIVRGTRKHFEEVIRVLLDNAVKFSRREKTIRAELQATADRVVLRIADRGQGFSPELARELFRPFTISDVLHHSQGTGLSLALASAIVQAYGGGIRAESRGLGTGATFEVYFPALRAGG